MFDDVLRLCISLADRLGYGGVAGTPRRVLLVGGNISLEITHLQFGGSWVFRQWWLSSLAVWRLMCLRVAR